MKIELPEPITRYLQAENSDHVDAIERDFTADAEVRDEGRVMRGRDAIRAWKIVAKARYRYRVELLSAQRQGDVFQLRVRVSGTFPGSPAELGYALTLDGDRIATLEIG